MIVQNTPVASGNRCFRLLEHPDAWLNLGGLVLVLIPLNKPASMDATGLAKPFPKKSELAGASKKALSSAASVLIEVECYSIPSLTASAVSSFSPIGYR